MKPYLIIIAALFFSFFCSCDNTPKSEKTNTPEKNVQTSNLPQYKNAEALGSIPVSSVQKLFDEATLIDYIFHELPFSMSQDDQTSIRHNLSYISTEVNEYIPVNCKPIARQFFQVNGDIFLEADVYFSENCKFYVFIENNKPVFSNKMSEAGINFFQQTIQQGLKAK